MKHSLSLFLFLLFFSLTAFAQMNEQDLALIGFRAGFINSSELHDLKNMVVPRGLQPEIWPHTRELPRNGYFMSLFGHQRIKNWPFVVQLEFSFASMGGDLETNVPDTTFHQMAYFKYRYLSSYLIGHWHPFLNETGSKGSPLSGIRAGIGGGYSLVLKNRAITFSSHDPSADLPVEDYMNEYLQGQSYPSIFISGGYEYFWNGSSSGNGFGITADARLGFGLDDAVKASSFIYDNTRKVRAQYWSFSLGMVIPLTR